MRKVVMQMLTTLNGRLDDPYAWISDIPDDLYVELDRMYATFDTILVGHVTYQEMLAYWPGAETDPDGSETSRSMAKKMNAYKKFVVSRGGDEKDLEWNNAELVVAQSDDDVAAFVNSLKEQSGDDIHLAGGARLAQTCVRLGLVDLYHLVVHPVVSTGNRWFDEIAEQQDFTLADATTYSNGSVGMRYSPRQQAAPETRRT
jgi:dihydrofolate reductase